MLILLESSGPVQASNGMALPLLNVVSYKQISVAERRGYVLRNASLGDLVVVRTS